MFALLWLSMLLLGTQRTFGSPDRGTDDLITRMDTMERTHAQEIQRLEKEIEDLREKTSGIVQNSMTHTGNNTHSISTK